MPIKRCRFGFNCGSMMMTPGITAEECPNNQVCGTLSELTPEEEVELIRVRAERQAEYDRQREIVRVNARQAAAMMLSARGCPQSVESLGVTGVLSQVGESLEQVRSRLSQYQGVYIAPPECELHHYSVKRPWGTYQYNKLTASGPIFEPSEKDTKVRVVHLSSDDDPRTLVGKEGIDRRNKLLSLAAKLGQIERELEIVLANL